MSSYFLSESDKNGDISGLCKETGINKRKLRVSKQNWENLGRYEKEQFFLPLIHHLSTGHILFNILDSIVV